MEGGATDQQTTFTSFLKIARKFLQATGWNLFHVENEFDEAKLPHEAQRPGIWGVEQASTSSEKNSRDNLASLYRPPFAMMHHGPFEKAKEAACGRDRWLLVNVQSTREFSSHLLNRDTWGNEVVAQIITSNFIFWQVCDDTEEGSKIVTYYKLDSVPATLVIDPITGQIMRVWCGMIQPQSLLEDVLQYADSSPKDHHSSLSVRHPMIGRVSVTIAVAVVILCFNMRR